MIFLFVKKDKNKCPKIKTRKKSWKKFTIFYNKLFKVLKETGRIYLHYRISGWQWFYTLNR
jgi:hypothetical protein